MLTKDNVQALRQADSIVVRIKRDKSDGDALTATVVCNKRLDDKVFQGSTDVSHEFEVAAYIPSWANRSCWVQLSPNGFGGTWEFINKLIRAGDKLVFKVRENGNDYLKAAVIPDGALGKDFPCGYSRIHADELCLTILRNGKTFCSEVVLAHSNCPDNSARPIQ